MTLRVRPAFLSAGELFGGVERHLLGMCTWMKRDAQAPLLILFQDGELARQARDQGFETVVLPARSSYDLSTSSHLADLLNRHEINVLHCHGYRAVVNGALAGNKTQLSLVRTVHGLVEPSPPWSYRGWREKGYTWLEQESARRSGMTVCYVTEDLRRRHVRQDRTLATSTIYNGIDGLDRSHYRRPEEWSDEIFRIVAVGRVTPVKGLEFALAALAELPEDRRIELDIIGDGPEVEALKQLAAGLGLADRVHFRGFQSRVFDFLAHADALIMPSRHEGLPFTILEAMSLGLPIIASDIGGLAEVLEHRKTAWLCPVGDVAALAEAMKVLSEDSECAADLGTNARSAQREGFSLEAMGAAYWEIYQSTLERDRMS